VIPAVATASATAELAAAPPASADAVTHASTGAGAAPRTVDVAGSIDGAARRAKNLERLGADASPVTVLSGGTPTELGQRLCEAVVPKRSPDTPVLVKPNIGGFDAIRDPAKSGGDDGVTWRTTSADFVRGVVRCLKARGHTRITVADGFGASHAIWTRLIEVSGFAAMAREEGVPLVAMDDDGTFDVEGDRPGKPVGVSGMEKTHVPTLLLPKLLTDHLEKGLFISVPKLKTHRFAVYSIGIKGMQGVVMTSDSAPAHAQKWRMHRELDKYLKTKRALGEADDRAYYVGALRVFAERLTDVLEVAAPDAVLVDGAPAVSGDGFQKLWPSKERFAFGGTNVITVDRIGAELLGLWANPQLALGLRGHPTSPLLELAAGRFKVDIASPPTAGDGVALLQAKRPFHYVSMAPFSIQSDPSPPSIPGKDVLPSP
jgi:uncharacterized protein (DUF362 family)